MDENTCCLECTIPVSNYNFLGDPCRNCVYSCFKKPFLCVEMAIFIFV